MPLCSAGAKRYSLVRGGQPRRGCRTICPTFGQLASLEREAGWLDGRSPLFNPLNLVFAVLGRFVLWAVPKSRPLPAPDGRQGLQRSPVA
jgi:hypothetical protein